MEKTALVIGATGLVGRNLVDQLLAGDEFKTVHVIARCPVDLAHEKLKFHVVDFDQLHTYQDLFKVDTVFCALGTTMKKAKSKEQFVKVDFVYPLAAAKLAKESDVRQFFIVTAMGANQHSPFFYNQVKGNIEAAIKELSFPTFYIIRPSLLLGKRNEQRLGEDFAQTATRWLPTLFKGRLKKYMPNKAESVARAMVKLSQKNEVGTFIVESIGIEEES